MIAIWIGIFLIVQAIVLVFALALGKSAALADKEFERARMKSQSNGSSKVERDANNTEFYRSPDSKPASRLGYSRSDP
jgi:hypothetical protein